MSADTGWISGGISNLNLDQAISKTTDGGIASISAIQSC